MEDFFISMLARIRRIFLSLQKVLVILECKVISYRSRIALRSHLQDRFWMQGVKRVFDNLSNNHVQDKCRYMIGRAEF